MFTYYYPPQPEAGSLRPAYLVKYLVDFGWTTTVVTPSPSGNRRGALLEPPSFGVTMRQRLAAIAPLRSAKRLYRNAVYFPDAAIFWLTRALREAMRAARSQQFDAVMSTALPGTMHIAGAFMRRRYALPWLADYRDLWTPNPYREFGLIRRTLEKQLERYLLRQANAITAVSDSFVDPLKALAPGSAIHVIPNAIDPEDWRLVPEQRPKEFRFCYGGRLYDGRRSPEVLFAALSALRANDEPAGLNARLDFYGPDLRIMSPMLARYGLASITTLHGVVHRDAMLRAERNSAVLVILLRPDKSTAREYGSKIYEYVGAKRPVLAIGGSESVVKTLVESSGLGVFVSEVEQCKDAIRTLYARFLRGDIEPRIAPSFQPFTARQLGSQFSEVLNGMVSKADTLKQR